MGFRKYMIKSATDRHYTIYVGPGGARCTCRDGRLGNRCKHIYFILMRELGVDENHSVLLKSEFSSEDLSNLL